MMTTTQTPRHLDHVSPPVATTDWETMRRVFQQFTTPMNAIHILRSCVPELSLGPCDIRDCVILDARLKTYLKPTSKNKSTLSACYRLTLKEEATGSVSQPIYYVKVFLDGRSQETFHLLTHGSLSDQDFHDAVTLVTEQDLIVWRFPHDPGLPHLRHVVDLLAVKQSLPAEGLRQIGIQEPPQILERQVVNYRPEIRCTNRYIIYDSSRDRTYQLFGKTFRETEGQALYERLHFFWDRSLAEPETMAIAQPLGYSAAVNTVWQRGVPGTPLLHILNRANYQYYIAAVAKGLASLHTCSLGNLATHLPDDHLIESRKKLTKLSDALPHLSDLLSTIATTIKQTAPAPSTIPFRPIHWDFHIDQLLADQGTLTFCDLDEVIVGDPIQDLAHFIVDLHVRLADRNFAHLIGAELCHQYQQLVPWKIQTERLAWHLRIQLVNKAYRYYLRFAPGFEDIVEGMLRLAQRGLTI
jgi:hypothetical protein